jgi:hypothetical protein
VTAAKDAIRRALRTKEYIAFLVALLGGAGTVIALWRPPVWISAIIAALAALLAAAVHLVQSHQQRLQDGEQDEQELNERDAAFAERLKLWPMPLVRDASPYDLGVFRSEIAAEYQGDQDRPPYVRRRVDGDLDRALSESDFVIVVGPSRAGKSRTAYEAAQRQLGGARLIVPRDRSGLREIAAMKPPPQGHDDALVWLENLDEFIGPGGLDLGLLRYFTGNAPNTRFLATIRWGEWYRLYELPQDEFVRSAQELLRSATRVELARELNTNELAEAHRLYPGERLVRSLGEHFAATDELLTRFKAGEEGNPAGYAMVRAAVDLRRAGLDRPVTPADLEVLCRPYWDRLEPYREPRAQELEDGIKWATRVEHRTAGLLVRDRGSADQLRPADYIVEFVEKHGLEVPSEMLAMVLDRVSPPEANRIAFTAYSRGDQAGASAAWQRVANSAEVTAAADAKYNLGLLAVLDQRYADADRLMSDVIDLGGPLLFPAALHRGQAQERRRLWSAAEASYRTALDASDREVSAAAANLLGSLFERLRRPDEAEASYFLAAQSTSPEYSPAAAIRLGLMLERLGKNAEARASYGQAVASGHPDYTPAAGVLLGRLIAHAGDRRRAKPQSVDRAGRVIPETP